MMFILLGLILILAIALFLPWFFAVSDIMKKEFKGNDRLMMFLLAGIPIIGPIMYFTQGKNMKKSD